MPRSPTNYTGLEQRLVLLHGLHSMLGYENTPQLLEDIKQAEEGFAPDGHSYIYMRLLSRGNEQTIAPHDLTRYDDNIRAHLEAMNAGRSAPITLRYFQYLAALYSEIFLDFYVNRRGELLRALNELVDRRNMNKPFGTPSATQFSELDLKKLAFWMATGSGKTLVMHLNYRQFRHYNREPLDNILLITPNEGLSEQHIRELQASNIPVERFDLNESGTFSFGDEIVKVTEITKLVGEKKGGGVSVPVEAFEGNNLIFVDEGHKGSGGEAWRSVRETLGETGFTFKYSATFGQALTAARNSELIEEYGKAIIFDYSYRYFYNDGYGKEFHILNLQQETTPSQTETLLLANLLSFYQQKRVFAEQAPALRPYNLEKPLWVFVGSSVNAVHTENRQRRSDVLTVAHFLHRLLLNQGGWVTESIGWLLGGESDLFNQYGEDVFADTFHYLRGRGMDAESMYRDILQSVFHAAGGGGLQLCDIRDSDGELGLKAAGADEYFGLIYIGDTARFKGLVEADSTEIAIEEDAFSRSLFEGINDPTTTIEVLVGAKKFMEGWNSWRVSNMGLLNIGRSEGSEIIQLFGRGVRLQGRNLTLKRSAALDGRHPAHIRLLETLHIFAIRANYMAQFRNYLEREGVPTAGNVELSLPIQANRDFLNKNLYIPRVPAACSFIDEENIVLDTETAITARVDLSLKIQQVVSGSQDFASMATQASDEQRIPSASLDLIDWQDIYIKLLEHKESKGFRNMVVRPDIARKILETEGSYQLIADPSLLRPRSFADVSYLQDAVAAIVLQYAEKFYSVQQERWESSNMTYTALTEADTNFQDYTIKIPRDAVELIDAVQQLISASDRIYTQEILQLPNIYFDRHLYQPLLTDQNPKIQSEPPGLNEGERRFVEDLRAYCRVEKDSSLAGKDLFLLRNLSRGKGIGFFTNNGFYPDFILWIKEGESQRIVFIEPHGMIHANAYIHDDKAQLHQKLLDLTDTMTQRSGLQDVTLDSFIISATPYQELRHRYDDGTWDMKRFAEAHILFRDNHGYLDQIKM